jgi:hypothetical protein
MTELKDNITEQIRQGELTAKPYWYFVLRALLFATGTILVALLSVYLLSFVFFIVRETGLSWTPGFGMPGLMFFALSSPWLLVSLVGIFLGILYVLVRHYSFSYRHPLVYSLVGTVLLVTLVASLLHLFTLHDRIQGAVEGRDIPALSQLYERNAGVRSDRITPGQIMSLTTEGFTIETPERITRDVRITDRTRHRTSDSYTPGMVVVVFGKTDENGTITALGIKSLNRDELPRRLQPPAR